jgi:threonine dehydratase
MLNRTSGSDLPCGGDTLAEGIAVKVPGVLTAGIIAQLVDEIVLVPERELEQAVAMLLQIEKTVSKGRVPRAWARCSRIRSGSVAAPSA